VASLKRRGGRVFLSSIRASTTRCACPSRSEGGSVCSAGTPRAPLVAVLPVLGFAARGANGVAQARAVDARPAFDERFERRVGFDQGVAPGFERVLGTDVRRARRVEQFQLCMDRVEVFLAQDLADEGQVPAARFPRLDAIELLERSRQARTLRQGVSLFARQGRDALAEIAERVHLALDLGLRRALFEVRRFEFVVQGMHPRVLTAGSLTFGRWS